MKKPADAIEDILRRARRPAVIGPSTWASVRSAFKDIDFEQWADGLERLIGAKIGSGAIIDFARASIVSVKHYGVEATMAMVPAILSIHRHAGERAVSAFLVSVPKACELLKDATAFRAWLATMEMFSELAPESVRPLADRIDFILSRLDVDGFRTWTLAGIRSAAGDPEFRASYFGLEDESALRVFEQASSDVLFVDVERRMMAFVMALWGLRPSIRTAAIRPGQPAPRRSAFDGSIIRIPEAYSGLHGRDAIAHYRAVISHIGAHAVFTRQKFPIGTLKPIQIALVSLVEDARVETLAAREYPGLRRLWARYHVAKPGTALTAELLMPRLARALIDPDYKDDDPWVSRGRAMFLDHRNALDNPSISREIGGLLGNDIGQMRIQFNAKTYVVEPSYRDDNSGLWEHEELPPEQAESAETVLDSVRIEKREDKEQRQKSENSDDGQPANRAARLSVVDEDVGVPVARYPEWDYVMAGERAEWATLVEFRPRLAPIEAARSLVEDHPGIAARIAKLVKNAKISRPERLRRQAQGDRLDLDACIRTSIDHRIGVRPDARVYESRVMRSRDLSVLVLLDISESTRDRIRDTTTTVISVERIAVALLAEAMAGLDDPFAIHAFCSDGRENVRFYRVKDFTDPYDFLARRRLAGLRGMLSTRLGAALRHAGKEISSQRTHRRLVLVVTDGEPSDVDVGDGKYLVEDARKAVHDLAHAGVDVFCVGLHGGGENYLPRIFGRRGFVMIDRVEALPERLPMLYFRMTA